MISGILICILVVLAIILVALLSLLFRSPKEKGYSSDGSITELVKMMREERERLERERQDKVLLEYGLKNIKREPEQIISTSKEEGPVKGGGDLIPYGLSEKQRKTLEDFYNKNI